jgi:hypothetical protein
MDSEESESADRYPIRGTFFGCCAAAGPVISKIVISKQKRTRILVLIGFLPLWFLAVN